MTAVLEVGDRIRLADGIPDPGETLIDACSNRLLRVQKTEGNEEGYILVSGTRYGDQWLHRDWFELVERRQVPPAERIQQARDVLAKWRRAATPRPWATDVSYAAAPLGTFLSANVHVDDWDVATFHGGPMPTDEGREGRARADRALVLLATDPDLLDAIDAQFAFCLAHPGFDVIASFVTKLAAAIIAADKRMTS